MPGFMTHIIGAQEALKNCPPPIVQTVKRYERLYNLGAQGPDLFFYSIPIQFREKTKSLGPRMHYANLGHFLICMAQQARALDGRERDELYAYTCGYLLHYCLDTSCHPYVYATAESDSLSQKENTSSHFWFETLRDVETLHRLRGKTIFDVKPWRLIYTSPRRMRVVANATVKAVAKVYGDNLSTRLVTASVGHMWRGQVIFRSRTGLWRRLFGAAERIFMGMPIFANLMHPRTTPQPYDTTFISLFNEGVARGTNLLQALWDYVYENGDEIVLVQSIGNLSLKTGQPCQ